MGPLRLTHELGGRPNVVENQMPLDRNRFPKTAIVNCANPEITGQGVALKGRVHVQYVRRDAVVVHAFVSPKMQYVELPGGKDTHDRVYRRTALDAEFRNVIRASPITSADHPAVL